MAEPYDQIIRHLFLDENVRLMLCPASTTVYSSSPSLSFSYYKEKSRLNESSDLMYGKSIAFAENTRSIALGTFEPRDKGRKGLPIPLNVTRMLLASCRESSSYKTVGNKESCLNAENPPLEVAGDVNMVSRLTLANRFRYYRSHNVAAFSLNSVSALSQTLSVFLLSTLSRWGSSWALKASLDSRGRREGR